MDNKYILATIISVIGIVIPIVLYLHKNKPKKTILIVDDDIEINPLFFKLLENQLSKWKIVFCKNPKEALKLLNSTPQKYIVITDLIFRSSKYDGISIVEKCINNKTDFIVMTGHSYYSLEKEMFELRKFGITKRNILQKPVSESGYNSFFNSIDKKLKLK